MAQKFLGALIGNVKDALVKTLADFGIDGNLEPVAGSASAAEHFAGHCFSAADWISNVKVFRGYDGRSLADTPEAREQVTERVKLGMSRVELAGIAPDLRFCLLSEGEDLGLPPAPGVLATVTPYDGRFDGLTCQAVLDEKNARFFSDAGASGGTGTHG